MSDQYRRVKKAYDNWRCRGEGRAYLAMLFSMCEGKCPRCGVDMVLMFSRPNGSGLEPNRATLDHIIPLVKTLKHDKFNLQILCFGCNTNKGDELEAVIAGKF